MAGRLVLGSRRQYVKAARSSAKPMRNPGTSRRSQPQPSATGPASSTAHAPRPLATPPLEVFADICKQAGFRARPPQDYWQTCTAFESALKGPRRPGWEAALSKEHEIPAQLIHHTAGILFTACNPSTFVAFGALTMHLLLAASTLGHAPATITASFLRLQPQWSSACPAPQLGAQLDRLVAAASPSPDALTVRGLELYHRAKQTDQALAHLLRAEDLANDHPDMAFHYAVDCLTHLGLISRAQGKLDLAKKYFLRVAADPPTGHGDASGWGELARTMGMSFDRPAGKGDHSSSPEEDHDHAGRLEEKEEDQLRARRLLLIRSLSDLTTNAPETWGALAECEAQLAERAARRGDTDEMGERRRWAEEWIGLCRPPNAQDG